MFFNLSSNARSLYVHWPFCPYKCSFCPFVAMAGQDHHMERYHRALVKDITTYADKLPSKASIDTFYMGGGTPSTYPDNLLLDMSGILRERFIISPSAEITMEVNPGTVRDEQLKLWSTLGINRLSIGVQSLKDSVLKNLNRHQTAADVENALSMASKYIENISVDFILGLPGVSAQEWKELMAKAVTWPVKHMSIYFLMVHEDTPLYFGVKKKQVTLPCDDETVALYYWTIEFLKGYAFMQYEISSFALEGYQSKHNTVYWDRKPYKAFGIGACEFDGTSRFGHEKNIIKYMNAVETDQDTISFHERLTPEQVYLEKLMLGLRRSVGVTFDDLFIGLSDEQILQVHERVALMQAHDFIVEKDGFLVLTPKGLAVENDIVARLSL